uniref:Uncharacterized protein n=1 Tax=viral metagenome TaxID=1070528 RepID=A0A6C0J5E2_9ZZZZ
MYFDITLINIDTREETVLSIKYGTKITSLKYNLEIPEYNADNIRILNKHNKELYGNIPITGIAKFMYELPEY